MFSSKCVLLNMSFTMAIFVFWCLYHVCNYTNDIYQIIDNSLHSICYTSMNVLFRWRLLLSELFCNFRYVRYYLPFLCGLSHHVTPCFGSLWIVSCSINYVCGIAYFKSVLWLHVSKFSFMHVHLHLLNHLKIC